MSNSISNLIDCTTPVQTAKVYNPMSTQYYLADQVKAAEAPAAQPDAAVKVTISPEAQAAMKG